MSPFNKPTQNSTQFGEVISTPSETLENFEPATMEDDFRVRVDKIFGSLSSSNDPRSLWSLTDVEVERNERNRDKDEEAEPATSIAKTSDEFLVDMENDLLDLDDDEEDEEEDGIQARESRGSSSQAVRGDEFNDEEREIKSNIGADCTLDYEEEEDQYDKQAVGKEEDNPEERLYMKSVNDYVADDCSFDELPQSFKDVSRDPRANRIAAKLRLKEDAEAAKKIDSLTVYEKEQQTLDKPKPILKRGDTQPDTTKPQKRVRFDPDCNEEFEDKSKQEDALDPNEVSTAPVDYPSGIPDYMRNPGKYTRYSFNQEDMGDKENKAAFLDYIKMMKKSDSDEPSIDESFELPKTVPFVPRRKTGDTAMAGSDTTITEVQNQDDNMHRRGIRISITEDEGDEACAMEEDEPETGAVKIGNNTQKSGRKYRIKERTYFDME